MSRFFSKSWFRVLSGLFINLSAGWLGLVIITPNFFPLTGLGSLWVFTYEVFFAILFLVIAVKLDERIKK